MGLVDRIERKLEATVGDAFARVFGGSIVPQEVEAMLRREADVGTVIGRLHHTPGRDRQPGRGEEAFLGSPVLGDRHRRC